MIRRSRIAVGLGAAVAAVALTAGAAAVATLPASAATGAAKDCATSLASGSPRVGRFGGIVRPQRTSSTACSGSVGRDPNSGGGTPPLINHGGPMMSTPANADKVVVTPIFWAPTGYSFDPTYPSLINTFLDDATADSDKSTNVFSTLFEYNGTNGFINYRLLRSGMITDTTAYPAAGCTTSLAPVYSDNSGYTTCLDDAQVQAEVNAQVTALGLHRDLGHMYVMFLPKHVESCFLPGNPAKQQCTLNASPSAAYCAYHGESGGSTVYANMPFPIYASTLPFTCGSDASLPADESPNGNTDADVEISPLSHEMSEAITDPDVNTGWYDSSGFENGDECAYKYGATAGTAGALYNQTINGHHYLTQEEFSNNNFNLGQGGCLQTYVPAAKPAVTALSVHAGPLAGGRAVTITGTTFGGTTAVHVGSTLATFTLIDPTHLKVTTPAHAAGTVHVTVTNSLGNSTIVAADKYTYENAPKVTAVSPASGPHRGGTKVTVTGTGFIGATKVAFGGVAGTSVNVVSGTKLTVVAPAHAAGKVNVRVTTPIGGSPVAAADVYHYV
jgi:hypothetical protein